MRAGDAPDVLVQRQVPFQQQLKQPQWPRDVSSQFQLVVHNVAFIKNGSRIQTLPTSQTQTSMVSENCDLSVTAR